MTRLLCSECRELQAVLYGSVRTDQTVRLRCGHFRSTGLLPVTSGRISLEHLGSERGYKLFPDERMR